MIAFGKGIGFPKIPYELTDLNKIWRTYYGINPSYLGLLNEISEDVFALSIKITDQAKMRIMNEINSNIVFISIRKALITPDSFHICSIYLSAEKKTQQ